MPHLMFFFKTIGMIRQHIRKNFMHRLKHRFKISATRHYSGGSIQKEIPLFVAHNLLTKFAPILRLASTGPYTKRSSPFLAIVGALLKLGIFKAITGSVFLTFEACKCTHGNSVKDQSVYKS